MFPTLCGGDAGFPLLEESTGEVARAARKLLLLKGFLRKRKSFVIFGRLQRRYLEQR